MRPRVGRLLGLVLGWVVTLVVVLVGLLLAAPFVLLGWLCLLVARLLQLFTRRAEVDGSADGGEPDALTPQLRDVIDGGRPAAVARVRDFLDQDPAAQLDCGCLRLARPQEECVKCGYITCRNHSAMEHYCDPVRVWQNAPLPPAVAASVNDAFAAIVNRSNVGDLKRVDQDLAKFYVIGDER